MPLTNATTGFYSDLQARQAAQEAKVKDELVAKLKQNRVLSDDQIDQFKRHVVGYYKKNLKRFRDEQLDLEKEYENVTLHFFVDATIEWMKDHAPICRCIQIYEDVISVIPCKLERPERTPPTEREKPETIFSKCRAAPRFVKSNAELIDALAAAANLEPERAITIRGTIVFADSTSGGKNYMSGTFCLSSGLVKGGRLGRDHMLSDVPNHYVRDRLMDYIDTQLEEEDQRERARAVVFPDLSPAEIQQYSVLVKQWLQKLQPKTPEELIALVAGDRPIRTDSERGRVLEQGYALEDVYKLVDLTPKPGFATRTYDRPGPILSSVVEPGFKALTPAERDLDPGTDIDRDCDQIRAMIAIFVFRKEWTADQFRLTLGDGIDRKDLTAFLCRDGPRKGKNSIYQLAWEFFKRRELLGLPLEETPQNDDVLQECDSNARKRPSTNANVKETRGKRTRGS